MDLRTRVENNAQNRSNYGQNNILRECSKYEKEWSTYVYLEIQFSNRSKTEYIARLFVFIQSYVWYHKITLNYGL